MAYIAQRMSERAFEAYSMGEKPLSKWTKGALLDAVKAERPELADALAGVSVAVLRRQLLERSSWHHTGAFYSRTDFWSLDMDAVAELDAETIERWKAERAPQKTAEPVALARATWTEWSGSRRHPTRESVTAVGLTRGGWFYYLEFKTYGSIKRKALDGNWIDKVEPLKATRGLDEPTKAAVKKLKREVKA